MNPAEAPAEFINIYRLIVILDPVKLEFLSRNKGFDIIISIKPDADSVSALENKAGSVEGLRLKPVTSAPRPSGSGKARSP